MPEEKKGEWKEKTLNLRISAEEHRKIKLLATEAGVSIKQYVFNALEIAYPEWRNKENQ